MVKVLFVCLGNICRSPMAEGLFTHLIQESDLDERIQVDSCGTSGWHIGEPADRRMRQTAQAHGISLTSVSRKIDHSDFREFDYIIAMDQSNLRDVLNMKENSAQDSQSSIMMMREFDPQGKGLGVPDPYYGGDDGFEEVFQILMRSCEGFLEHVRQQNGI